MCSLATLLAIGALVAPAAALGAHAGSSGTCVRAELPWPVVLPDGSRHPAGRLRICHGGAFTPVSAVHRTYVGGTYVGTFLSRRVESEGPVAAADREPFMLFRRDEHMRWRLQGYSLPEGDGRVGFRMIDPWTRRGERAGEQRWVSDNGPPSPAPGSGWAVLLASGPH
jgi:hypothetical protein